VVGSDGTHTPEGPFPVAVVGLRGLKPRTLSCQGNALRFDGYGEDAAPGLALRHDHGSQFMSDLSQPELRFLGIAGSPSFVREPEGNA
jgi:hypothetical protein